MRELQAQVGSDWIKVYQGVLQPSILEEACTWEETLLRTGEPFPNKFEWPNIAQKTIGFYHEIVD